MDPNACLARITAALRDGDDREAVDAIGDLLGWLNKGGFMPTVDRRRLVQILGALGECIENGLDDAEYETEAE